MRRAPEALTAVALSFVLLCLTPLAGRADVAYVTCQNGEVLSVIDLSADDPAGALALWELPGKPAGVAVSKTGGVYTVSPDSKEIRRLDPISGIELARTVLDGGPIGVAVDAARGRLFVSDWYNARIWVLDAQDLSITRELATGAAPAGIAISDDGRFVATAERDSDQVSIFDADTLDLLHRVKVGERPFGLGFAPDGRLFVGNVGTNDVSVVDPDTGTQLATHKVGERPYGVAFARGRAFVTNQYEDSVSVLDLETLDDLGKISVGEYPEGIDTTSDGRYVVVANWFENTISVIDADTLTVVRSYDTGDGPRAFGKFLLKGDRS